MVIGIDASRANKIQKTGVEWYSHHLIQAMKEIADPNDRLFLYSREPLRGELGKLPANFESRVLKWPPKRIWTHLRLSCEMATNAPDVLFVPSHTLPYVHAKVSVVTCHDVGFEVFPELYRKSELRRQKWAMKFHLEKASKILAISEFTKREVVRIYGVDPDKIEVVHLAYDDAAYRPTGDERAIAGAKIKYGVEGEYMLYVGRLEKKKNSINLLEAFRLMRRDGYGGKLVLAGSPGYGYDEIEKKAVECGFGEALALPGRIDQTDLPLLMAGARLFVFPSLYEGFGMPVLEAMACGTPVAASDAASIPEVAGGAALLFNPGDPGDMARKMEDILEDEKLRRQTVAKGLHRAAQFSWTRCARATLKILKSLQA